MDKTESTVRTMLTASTRHRSTMSVSSVSVVAMPGMALKTAHRNHGLRSLRFLQKHTSKRQMGRSLMESGHTIRWRPASGTGKRPDQYSETLASIGVDFDRDRF